MASKDSILGGFNEVSHVFPMQKPLSVGMYPLAMAELFGSGRCHRSRCLACNWIKRSQLAVRIGGVDREYMRAYAVPLPDLVLVQLTCSLKLETRGMCMYLASSGS